MRLIRMDIGASSVGATGNISGQARVGDAVGITVMKKAMDIQSSAATQLVSSIPDPAAKPASESHLGNEVDLRA